MQDERLQQEGVSCSYSALIDPRQHRRGRCDVAVTGIISWNYIFQRAPSMNRRPALIALEKWSSWPDPTRL